jgi:hypothetical protein
MGLIKSTKFNPHFVKGYIGNDVTSFVCCSILDSLFIDNLSQAWQYWRTSLCIIGHQYFVCRFLQIVILDEKCPQLTPCISYSIMGIFESSWQRFKTWS